MRDAIDTVAGNTAAPPTSIVEISVPGGARRRAPHVEPAARHRRRYLDPRHDGRRGALLVLGVDPLDPSWHRHRTRGRPPARRRVHRCHVGGRRCRRGYGLPETAHARHGRLRRRDAEVPPPHPVPRLTIGGGFAKLSKLAQGHLDLHSGRSQVDLDGLADLVASLGGSTDLVDAARRANTAARGPGPNLGRRHPDRRRRRRPGPGIRTRRVGRCARRCRRDRGRPKRRDRRAERLSTSRRPRTARVQSTGSSVRTISRPAGRGRGWPATPAPGRPAP